MEDPAVTTDGHSYQTYQASASHTKALAVQGVFEVALLAGSSHVSATALQTIVARTSIRWTWEAMQVRLKVLVELEKGGPQWTPASIR